MALTANKQNFTPTRRLLAAALTPLLGLTHAHATHADLMLEIEPTLFTGNTVRTVAVSDTFAPAPSSGGLLIAPLFDEFIAPTLNNAGQTAFRASLTGIGVNDNNEDGVYSESSGALKLVARSGGQAPVSPGDGGGIAPIVSFDVRNAFPRINNAGQTVFNADLTGPSVGDNNSRGLYREEAGILSEVVRTGNQTPGAAQGVRFFGINYPAMNATGQVAFRAFLEGPGVDSDNNVTIYIEDAGDFVLAAQEGDQAPGQANNVVFDVMDTPTIDASGQVAFGAFLAGPGINLENRNVLVRQRDGALVKVAQDGDQAPGTNPGVSFDTIFTELVSLNTLGQTAFGTLLSGPGVDDSNDRAIYREDSGELTLVARTGDQAPNTNPGVVFDFLSTPGLNASGTLVFSADLAGEGVDASNENGVYLLEEGGQLTEVARAGDQAPDAVDGVRFLEFDFLPTLNAAGQIAFGADLAGEGVNESNDRGIYATDLNGVLVEIAREGDLLDINDDPLVTDLRSIESLAFIGGLGPESGSASGFNDLGQLSFHATFTDGSEGVFVTTIRTPPIPEPGTAALATIGLTLVGMRRRRP